MRPFYVILVLALIAALGAPFFMEGPTGQPLMTVDDFVDDNVPRPPTQVYRWQDEHGVWQFGESPAEGTDAEPVDVSQNLTPFEAQWAAEWEARHPPENGGNSANIPSGSPSLPDLGNVYDGAAMEKAEAAAELMEQRIHDLQGVMDEISSSK